MVWAHLGPWVQFVTNLIPQQLNMRNGIPASSLAPMLRDALGCVLQATLTQALCTQIQPPSIQTHEILIGSNMLEQTFKQECLERSWSEGCSMAHELKHHRGCTKGFYDVLCLSLSWHFTKETAKKNAKSQKLFVRGWEPTAACLYAICVCVCMCP